MAVTVKWLEHKQFVGIDSTGHSVVLSSPADGVGMKPSDLLLVALAGWWISDRLKETVRRKNRRLLVIWNAPGDTQSPRKHTADLPTINSRHYCV